MLSKAMGVTRYSLELVNDLRKRAEDAAPVPEETPNGWSISQADPSRIVAVFSALRLKPDYALRAYQFREGGNGNGFVYAMPAEVPLPPPDDCTRDQSHFLEPPRPSNALDDVMEAIDGDGSPLSYLQASLLKRELAEFGAMWHGCEWGTHTILGRDPLEDGNEDENGSEMDRPSGTARDWDWERRKPKHWDPAVTVLHERIRCSFYTFTGLGQEQIQRHTDSYRYGQYRPKTRTYSVATGPHGFVF